MRIALISAAFPPDLDGIGDYTWWMAKTLVELGHQVTVFTRKGVVTDVPGGAEVVGFYEPSRPDSFADLVPALRSYVESGAQPEWMVLQYNPFSWGRRGWCPAVPLVLQGMKRHYPGLRMATMFHETMVPRWPWRFTVMWTWQRRFFGQTCRASDRIFVSTQRWLPQVAATQTRAEATVLPVGSNIPVSGLDRAQAKARLNLPEDQLIVGIFGGAHGSRRLDWIAEAVKQYLDGGRLLQVVHVGPNADAVAAALGDVPLRSLGVIPSPEVADMLRAMDCLISPFVDGISTRRGSVMAALQNAVPVATTVREWTDRVFLWADRQALLLSPASDACGFAIDAVPWMAARSTAGEVEARAFAEREFAWPVIARAMLGQLPAIATAS